MRERRRKIRVLIEDWEKKRGRLDKADARDRAYREAVSGNDPRQRATPLPRSLVTEIGPGDVRINGLVIFEGAHPSRFVFLRHDVTEGAEWGNQRPYPLQRTLRKGEAVLAVGGSTIQKSELRVLSIDGARSPSCVTSSQRILETSPPS